MVRYGKLSLNYHPLPSVYGVIIVKDFVVIVVMASSAKHCRGIIWYGMRHI